MFYRAVASLLILFGLATAALGLGWAGLGVVGLSTALATTESTEAAGLGALLVIGTNIGPGFLLVILGSVVLGLGCLIGLGADKAADLCAELQSIRKGQRSLEKTVCLAQGVYVDDATAAPVQELESS